MRKDMAQLLVEHPRHNVGELYREHRRRANLKPEEAPTKQGMRRPYFERKEFGEYFAPIQGFLRKNVGRYWDLVFSELSGSLTGGGAVVDHVRLHVLRDFVTRNPVWRDGVACYPPGFGVGFRDEPLPITRRRNNGFYVDQLGVLRQAPVEKSRKKLKRKPLGIAIDNAGENAYYRIDSVWYRVWLKALPPAGPDAAPLFDLVLKTWIRCRYVPGSKYHGEHYRWDIDGSWWGTNKLFEAHGRTRVACRREQLGSRQIRRLKLNERFDG